MHACMYVCVGVVLILSRRHDTTVTQAHKIMYIKITSYYYYYQIRSYYRYLPYNLVSFTRFGIFLFLNCESILLVNKYNTLYLLLNRYDVLTKRKLGRESFENDLERTRHATQPLLLLILLPLG